MIGKNQLNVGILSDSPFFSTGYSDQSKSLGNILTEAGHNVIYFGQGYMGQVIEPGVTLEDKRKLNFKIIGQGTQPYFQDVLSQYVKEYKIQVLIILLDTFMIYPFFHKLDLSPAKVIFWFPSDGGGGLPLGCENVLRAVHQPIAMAKFGQAQVKACHNLDTLYIPHAIDTKNYFPVSPEERKKLRQQWGLDDKFVIGCVARNQGRKMLDREVKIMARYAKINPNAVLFLHLDVQDPAQVFPIDALIRRFGIENRVIFTGMKYYKGWNYKDMYKIYNVMDVFLLTTSGEGFGIPIIEAQACGVPCLVTNYTTTKELVCDSKAGLGINLAGTTEEENPDVHNYEIISGSLTGSWGVERGLCDISDGVKKLDWLCKNPTEREIMRKNGIENIKKNYNWENVGKTWIELIEKMGNQY